MAASKFPKVRETRPPKLSELREIKDQLEPKFYYLFDAPDTDDVGNPTILRWSRKIKSNMLVQKKDGKATRFALVWRDGAWVQA